MGRTDGRPEFGFRSLLFSSGLRLTEAAWLLTLEVPQSEMRARG
jgi:hypothetical protein